MSTLQYNNIKIPYCLTKGETRRPVWTPDDSDYLYTEIVIDVQGLIVDGWTDGDPPTPPGGGGIGAGGQQLLAPDAVAKIVHYLEQPRKPLLFQFGNRVQVDSGPDKDLRNGPFPELLSIPRPVGDGGIWINFRVKTYLNECPNAGSAPPRYISNRWQESETFDSRWMSRRVRQGKLVVRPGRAIDSNAARYLVSPPIPMDFLRVRAEYQVSENGLELGYTFEDQEQYRMPPLPAIEASGEFVEVHPNPGSRRIGMAKLRLVGAKHTPKSKLVYAGIASCFGQLAAARMQINQDGLAAMEMSISSNTFANEVTVTMKANLNPYSQTTALTATLSPVPGNSATQFDYKKLPVDLTHFDSKPWDDPRPPEFPLRSENGLRLVAAALNDPCLGQLLARTRVSDMYPGGSALRGEGADVRVPGINEPSYADGQTTAVQAAAPPPPPPSPGGTVQPETPTGEPPAQPLPGQITLTQPNPPLAEIRSRIPAATLTVVPTVPDPEFGSPISVSQGGPYSYYKVSLRFLKDKNVVALPIMAKDPDPTRPLPNPPPPACRFVQLGRTQLTMLAEWVAEREGAEPVIPPEELDVTQSTTTTLRSPAQVAADQAAGQQQQASPYKLQKGDVVLLHSEVDPGQVEQLPGGAFRYRVAGSYKYGFKYPELIKPVAAVPPWVRDIELAVGIVGGGLTAALNRVAADTAATAALGTTSPLIIVLGQAGPPQGAGPNA